MNKHILWNSLVLTQWHCDYFSKLVFNFKTNNAFGLTPSLQLSYHILVDNV